MTRIFFPMNYESCEDSLVSVKGVAVNTSAVGTDLSRWRHVVMSIAVDNWRLLTTHVVGERTQTAGCNWR